MIFVEGAGSFADCAVADRAVATQTIARQRVEISNDLVGLGVMFSSSPTGRDRQSAQRSIKPRWAFGI
jgi:hypothetical protein